MGEWCCWTGHNFSIPMMQFELNFQKYSVRISSAMIDKVDMGILKLCFVEYSLAYSFIPFSLNIRSDLVRFTSIFQLSFQTCHKLKVGWHKTHEGRAASIRVLLLHKCSMFSMTENPFINWATFICMAGLDGYSITSCNILYQVCH